jgi:DNA-binding transcriptional MerR regulator
MKRGGGRRYYRPEDMELLRGIRHLLHAEGYTIKGVQKILREQGIDSVKQFGRGDATNVRSLADARALPANVPAIGAASNAAGRGSPTVAARRASRRGRAGAAEELATVEAAIKELELCRSILLETLGKGEPVRAPRRARAVGA